MTGRSSTGEMMMMSMRGMAFTAVTPMLLGGCGGGATPSGPLAELTAAEASWEAQGLTDYRFDFDRSCFCAPPAREPVTIEVRGGEVARVTSRLTGEEIQPVEGIAWYSIDGLFALIRQAEADGIQPIRVAYAPNGQPRSILIGELANDSGVEYTIGEVRRL